MKKLILSLMAVPMLAALNLHAQQEKGIIDFQTVPIQQVLDIYQKMSGFELVRDSHLKDVGTKITLKTSVVLSKDEATKFLEQGLRDQAGIVITPLDDKRVSVTCNDALPVTRSQP